MEKLKTVLARIPALVFALDQKGNICALEGGECARLGIEPSSLIGQSVFKVKNLPLTKSHFQKALKNLSPADPRYSEVNRQVARLQKMRVRDIN